MPVHEGHGSVSVSVSSTVAPTTAAATAATTEPTLVKRTPVSVTAKGSSDKPKDKGKGKGKGKDKDKGKGKDTVPTETEEPLAPVPIEAGWNRTAGPPPPTSKKQRENLAKAQKRKEQKSAQETLQMERLRQHQKQLATQKINAFYTTGAGKPSSWKNPQGKHSAKVPTTSAGLNEHGQLIWD
ncbi:hypothetical protein BDF14DRAFT_1740292 [Spinellus fusiger]|nr:hypothetical protein BDF14DRAFT_1740292 [Spinellus fusiger]